MIPLHKAKRSYEQTLEPDLLLMDELTRRMGAVVDEAVRNGDKYALFDVPTQMYGIYPPYSVDEVTVYLVRIARSHGYRTRIARNHRYNTYTIRLSGWVDSESSLEARIMRKNGCTTNSNYDKPASSSLPSRRNRSTVTIEEEECDERSLTRLAARGGLSKRLRERMKRFNL